VGIGQYRGVVLEGGDLLQVEVSGLSSGGGGEDGVLESLWLGSAAGAY